MSDLPTELKYLTTHEWIRLEDDGTATVGITEHAQELLGDMVYVELPQVESELGAGDESGVVESVKAASDIYMPITGEIVGVNEALEEEPELVNQDPYGAGWLFKIKPADENDLDQLLSADDYKEQIDNE